ncbi:hypothetical protein ACMA5I_13735 [Paracoccaceae bacterium GXU_MW_L88]
MKHLMNTAHTAHHVARMNKELIADAFGMSAVAVLILGVFFLPSLV